MPQESNKINGVNVKVMTVLTIDIITQHVYFFKRIHKVLTTFCNKIQNNNQILIT